MEAAELEAKESAQAVASSVKGDVERKRELQRKLEEEAAGDPEARAALIAALKKTDDDIAAKLAAESGNQQSKLADKLAERKRRRAAQAQKERELKVEHAATRAQQQQEVVTKQTELQDQARNAKFEGELDRMLMEKTADELPAAVLAALDGKHQEELDDLLMKLYQ